MEIESDSIIEFESDINKYERENVINLDQDIQLENRKYIIFCETIENSCEEIYFFINYGPNKEILHKISQFINKVEDWPIEADRSIFSIDINNLVSEKTVNEMCLCEIFSHRKFNGKMKDIQFALTKRGNKIEINPSSNDKNIIECLRKLFSNQEISKYLTDEEKFFTTNSLEF